MSFKEKDRIPYTDIHMINNGIAAMSLSFADAFEEQALTYTRIICLKNNDDNNGTLIATCDQHSWVNDEQVWPIYTSTNGGARWNHIADVTDTIFGTNRKAQPMLFELPQDVGSIKKGTILLAGNLVPFDNSSSRIVIYQSIDLGRTWTFLSTVDTGGPFIYDPSPESTTTTIWEPFLYLDSFGHLVCAYSDERQKDAGILQALCLRYSNDGHVWSDLINIVAIPNHNDRPGMITVSKLPSGRYIASYEVVNLPSLQQNSSVVYCKFSDDGITWTADDVGDLVKTINGLAMGSSPYIKWVDAGGPNGMVIIGSKWGVNQHGDIMEGGQCFFVNYNLGTGCWERFPQPLTWNATDIVYLDAFSQCLETNEDDTLLYQTANIVNIDHTGIDLRFGSIPLYLSIYEMENAVLNDVTIEDRNDASNGKEIGYFNYSRSSIEFKNIKVPYAGTYVVFVRYNNGTDGESRHLVTVNNENSYRILYPVTVDWNRYQWASITCTLKSGNNSIRFEFLGTFAELDCLVLFNNENDLSRYFMIKNRLSGKFLRVIKDSLEENTLINQHGFINSSGQIWVVEKTTGTNFFQFRNRNSNMLCQVMNASIVPGEKIVQHSSNGQNTQSWILSPTSDGYFYIINRNSDLLLSIATDQESDESPATQENNERQVWQEWTFVKEGVQ
ncbi:MAG: RICIN domain-containing protein [Treponema sp.]|jgi:hypothetical protein|nr:RICIN domain-containing protein [Treponema sp.]